MSDICIGISIGNTNCAAALYKDDQITVLVNENESKTTPTIVSFTDEEYLIGESAMDTQNAQEKAAKNTIIKLKTFLGTHYNDPNVQKLMAQSKCTISQSNENTCLFEIEYKKEKQKFAPEVILSFILKYFKDIASTFSNSVVTQCMIPTPFSSHDQMNACVLKGAKQSDLKCFDAITEPVACCYAYELFKPGLGSTKHLVFDFGGTSCSLTLLNICDIRYNTVANLEDVELGGRIIDELLRDHILSKESKKFKKGISEESKENLLKACEQAKKQISLGGQAVIKIERFDGESTLKVHIKSQDFSELIKPVIKKCSDMVEKILKKAGYSPNDVDHVILSGGSSNLKDVQDMLLNIFKKKDVILKSIDPSEVVAYGAAYGGAIIINPNLLDRLSITTHDNSYYINYSIVNPHESSEESSDFYMDSDENNDSEDD